MQPLAVQPQKVQNMSIDIAPIAQQMLTAALPVVSTGAQHAEPIARVEFTKLAHTIATTGELMAAGQMSREEGTILVEMQKHASRSVLLTLQGVSLLAAEQAITTAIGTTRPAFAAALAGGVVGPWPP
jgi:hypothetical protein